MKKIHALAALLLIASTAGFALGWARQKNVEEAAVRQTVEHYLHGLKHNDVESLKKAFWSGAKLFFVVDGKLGQLSQEDWYKTFAGSEGKVEAGDLRITAVDITGNAASVKVEEDYPNSKYTDYLSLLKIQGQWWIVNKIYTSERKSH